MTESIGSLAVLNVGAGDIEIRFNQHDTGEAAKAIRMLQDMKSRGYAVLVRDEDGVYQRATAIDATRGRYVLMLPEDMPLPADAEVAPSGKGNGRRRRRGARAVSVPIRARHAVGVARSAGG